MSSFKELARGQFSNGESYLRHHPMNRDALKRHIEGERRLAGDLKTQKRLARMVEQSAERDQRILEAAKKRVRAYKEDGEGFVWEQVQSDMQFLAEHGINPNSLLPTST